MLDREAKAETWRDQPSTVLMMTEATEYRLACDKCKEQYVQDFPSFMPYID